MPVGEEDAVYEIGGADRVTYRELVEEVARQCGPSTRVLTVPVPASPVDASALSSFLANLVPERARLLVGADVVEVIPTAVGSADVTALVADRIVREILNGIALRRRLH